MTQIPDPRIDARTTAVLRALLQQPSTPLGGLGICARAGLETGTIYPILARLERAGWLESFWDETGPREEGQPRRRLYKLTRAGDERARIALAQTTESQARRGTGFAWPARMPGTAL